MILDTRLIHCEKVLTQPTFESVSPKRTQPHAQDHVDSTRDKKCFLAWLTHWLSHRSFPDEDARFKRRERNTVLAACENADEWRHMR